MQLIEHTYQPPDRYTPEGYTRAFAVDAITVPLCADCDLARLHKLDPNATMTVAVDWSVRCFYRQNCGLETFWLTDNVYEEGGPREFDAGLAAKGVYGDLIRALVLSIP